jgi:hypothetical protein
VMQGWLGRLSPGYVVGLRILNYYGEIVFGQTGQVTGDEVAELRLILESVQASKLTLREI